MDTTSATSIVREYQLSDDLARLCLPREFKESHRHLAWVNSICFLFLAVGLVGLKPPPIIEKPINQPTEIIPVVFTPPEEPPPVQQEQIQEEPEIVQDVMAETPQVVTVVAAADAPNVAFAVPVQGAVAIAAQAHLAPPPPPVTAPPRPSPPKPVQFNPQTVADGGVYPPPTYPQVALRNRYKGTVEVLIEVEPTGAITSVSVQKSSGHSILDDAAVSVVKNRWRFPADEKKRLYIWPCIFETGR